MRLWLVGVPTHDNAGWPGYDPQSGGRLPAGNGTGKRQRLAGP